MKGKESCGKEEKREGRDQKKSVENKKSGHLSEDASDNHKAWAVVTTRLHSDQKEDGNSQLQTQISNPKRVCLELSEIVDQKGISLLEDSWL